MDSENKDNFKFVEALIHLLWDVVSIKQWEDAWYVFNHFENAGDKSWLFALEKKVWFLCLSYKSSDLKMQHHKSCRDKNLPF